MSKPFKKLTSPPTVLSPLALQFLWDVVRPDNKGVTIGNAYVEAVVELRAWIRAEAAKLPPPPPAEPPAKE
jgi:hypothetical protein